MLRTDDDGRRRQEAQEACDQLHRPRCNRRARRPRDHGQHRSRDRRGGGPDDRQSNAGRPRTGRRRGGAVGWHNVDAGDILRTFTRHLDLPIDVDKETELAALDRTGTATGVASSDILDIHRVLLGGSFFFL
jgi:hypothetical protein